MERWKVNSQPSIGLASAAKRSAAALVTALSLFAAANGQDTAETPNLSVFRKNVGIVSLAEAKRSVHLFESDGVEAVAGDFDADGRMDTGTFDTATRLWTVRMSSDSSTLAVNFPMSKGKSPVRPEAAPADIDGDGQTDLVVFCAGAWYVISPSRPGAVETSIFGKAGDIPVPADYDGDKKADLAVFRPSENRWYVRNSETGEVSMTDLTITGTDVLVAADFTGDGKADITVYRRGEWHTIDSEKGVAETFKFGFEDASPAVVDLNRDGRMDMAVVRKGTWYIYDGSSLVSHKFGDDDDIPLSMAPVKNSGKIN